MANERSDKEKEAHRDTKSGVRGRVHRVQSLRGEKEIYFLLSFVLLTVRLEPSAQLRIPAR